MKFSCVQEKHIPLIVYTFLFGLHVCVYEKVHALYSTNNELSLQKKQKWHVTPPSKKAGSVEEELVSSEESKHQARDVEEDKQRSGSKDN